MKKSKEECSQIRPWARYFARMIDYYLFSIFLAIFIGFFFYYIEINDYLLGFLIPFLWIPIESLLLSTAGTTPGKWLYNTKVMDVNGKKLKFSQAWKRSWSVLVNGLGLGIPIVSLFTLISSYNKLNDKGITTWDKDGKTKVKHKKIGIRILGIIIAVFLIFSLIAYGSYVEEEAYQIPSYELQSPVVSVPQVETLPGGYVIYNEFSDQTSFGEVTLKLQSDYPLSVYIVPSEESYDDFMVGDYYQTYPGCSFEEKLSSTLSCNVSSGGVIVYNPNQQEAVYTLEMS